MKWTTLRNSLLTSSWLFGKSWNIHKILQEFFSTLLCCKVWKWDWNSWRFSNNSSVWSTPVL